MAKYRVKAGKIHTVIDGKAVVLQKGDTFECEPYVVTGLSDHVEPVETAGAPVVIPETAEAAADRVFDENKHLLENDSPPFEIRKREGLPQNQPAFDVYDVAADVPVNTEPLFKAAAVALLEEKLGG